MGAASRIRRARSLLGVKQWAWATGLALAASASLPLMGLDNNSYWMVERLVSHTPWFLLFSYMFIATIAWVESGSGAPSFPVSSYVRAIAAVSGVCIALAWVCGPIIPMAPRTVTDGRLRPTAADSSMTLSRRLNGAYIAVQAGFDAMLATMIYVRLRNSRLAARALAEAEYGRSEASRKLLASRLEAAQAEIDPARIIQALEAIERAYDDDPAAAETRLDELIAFIRGAIPHLRSIAVPAEP
jgi:hypothetical protein